MRVYIHVGVTFANSKIEKVVSGDVAYADSEPTNRIHSRQSRLLKPVSYCMIFPFCRNIFSQHYMAQSAVKEKKKFFFHS